MDSLLFLKEFVPSVIFFEFVKIEFNELLNLLNSSSSNIFFVSSRFWGLNVKFLIS